MMNNNIKNILVKYKNILKEKGFDTYSLDVELLLMHSTGLSKTDLYLNTNYELTSSQLNIFEECFERRLKKEPIAYILGKWEFMGLEFLLDNSTLIPRSETELLVETTLDIINNLNLSNINILDMCTGSGAIAIALSKHINININNINIIASDINKKALKMAEENAKLNNINNIKFIESDLFDNLDSSSKFNIIVSNPPYIKSSDINTLEDNVKKYEPVLALDGGESGLIFYEQIIANSKNYFYNNNLNNNYLIFEIGYDQAEDLKNMLLKNNFNVNNIKIIKDFSNLDRVVVAKI